MVAALVATAVGALLGPAGAQEPEPPAPPPDRDYDIQALGRFAGAWVPDGVVWSFGRDESPSISADGRLATTYEHVQGPDGRWNHRLHVIDTITGELDLVRTSVDGQGVSGVTRPWLSGDGHTVGFTSGDPALRDLLPDPDDWPGRWMWVHDRDTEVSMPVPVHPEVPLRDLAGLNLAGMTDDGNQVLVAGRNHLYVADIGEGTSRYVAGMQDGIDRITYGTAMSGDGRHVASCERDAVGGVRTSYVRVRDLSGPEPVVVEEVPILQVAYCDVDISDDGEVVAWSSYTAASGPYFATEVLDRGSDARTTVPQPPGTTPYRDSIGFAPLALSGDGSTVVFGARSDDDAVSQDLYAYDVAAGTVARITAPVTEPRDWDTGCCWGASRYPAVSGDGATLVFYTTDSRLIDPNDVFERRYSQVAAVARRSDAAAPVWPDGATLRVDDVGSTFATVSWDEATDDIGVVRYRVLVDGEPTLETAAGVTTATLTPLAPDTDHEVSVVAEDGAGRTSTPLVASVRTAASSATAALTATPRADGTVSLVWDPADGDHEGFRVLRTVEGATTTVGEPTGANFVDVGAPADRQVTYLVEVVRAGIGYPHAGPATVTTAALTAPEVAWTGTRLRTGHLVVGTDVEVTVTGQPGRQVEAAFGVELDDGDDGSLDVDLTETAPGTYAGRAGLAEGMVRLLDLEVRFGDGAGGQVAATGRSLPAPVAGAVLVSFDTAAPLDGSTMEVSSPSLTWANQVSLSGTDAVRVGALPRADHELRAWRPDGVVGATHGPVTVAAGRTTPVTVTFRHAAELVVSVVDPDGDPMPDAEVRVRADGSPNATHATTPADGQVTSTGWTDGLSALVSVASTLVPLEPAGPTSVDLAPETNELTVVATPVPAASASGSVRQGSDPVPNASMTLSQVIEGAPVTDRVTTAEDGSFTLTGVRGPALLSVTGPTGATRQVQVVLPVAGMDMALNLVGNDVVDLDLRVQEPGRDEPGARVGIDWSTAVHLQVRIEVLEGSARVAGTWVDSKVRVAGQVGSRFRICADGREMAGPAGCSDPVTLGGRGEVLPVALVLAAPAGLSAALYDGQGAPLSGTWRASVSGPGGSSTFVGNGPSLAASVNAPGRYQVTVTSSQHGSTSTTVDLPGGLSFLGSLVLSRGGPFGGGANSVTLTRSEVLPGDVVEARVEMDAVRTTPSAVLQLSLPEGWSPRPEGATRSGEAVEVTGGPGTASIALGDLGPGEPVVVRVSVQVPANQPTGVTEVVAASVLSVGTYPVGVATVEVSGVTIDAPETVPVPEVRLSGRAPAGSLVTIFERDQAIGLTVSGPGGVWNARVDLPARPPGSEYLLRASAEADGQVVTSEEEVTVLDPYQVRLRQVAVRQQGRVVRFDPDDGVARFPFVIVNAPLHVELTFDRPDLVRWAHVDVGELSGEAVLGPDGTFVATLPLRMGREGDIWVAFDADRVPVDPADADLDLPETLDELRALLPPGAQDIEFTEVKSVPGDEGTDTVEARAELPSLATAGGPAPELTITASVRVLSSYTPTSEDRALAQAAGVPIYAARATLAPDGMSGSASGIYMPPGGITEDMLQPGSGGRSASAGRPRAPVGGVAAGVQLAWNITSVADTANTLFHVPSRYRQLDQLERQLDRMEECGGDPSFIAETRERVRIHRWNARIVDAFNGVVIAGSFAAGLATFGIGVVVGLAGWGISQLLSHMWKKDYQEIAADIRAAMDDLDCKKKKRKRRVGSPGYGYDPSGFVFEAVEANRLPGVTATALYAPDPAGPWEVWDATWYAQENPLITDEDGRYAWDVPRGFWRVRYEHDGYVTGFSDVLEVLPPHFDVDVGLTSTAAPTLVEVDGAGTIELSFSQYMQTAWVTSAAVEVVPVGEGRSGADPDGEGASRTVADRAGEDPPGEDPPGEEAEVRAGVVGTVVPVDPALTPEGIEVAERFRFVPTEDVADGTELAVSVFSSARNYAGRPLDGDARSTVTFVEAGPGDPGGPDDPDDPDAPGAPGRPGGPDGPPGPYGPGGLDGPRPDPLDGRPGSGVGGPSGSGALPRTGTGLIGLAGLALLLLAAGATLRRGRRIHTAGPSS